MLKMFNIIWNNVIFGYRSQVITDSRLSLREWRVTELDG